MRPKRALMYAHLVCGKCGYGSQLEGVNFAPGGRWVRFDVPYNCPGPKCGEKIE